MANAGDVRAGGAFVEIGTDDKALAKGLNSARKQIKSAFSNIQQQAAKAGAAMTAFGGAITGVMAVSARDFARAGDEIAKFGSRIGVATQELSEYQFVAERSGVSTNTLRMAWQRMTRRISEASKGSGEAQDAIRELGLSAAFLASLSPDKQFEAIATAMQGVASEGDRVRLAMRLFDSEGVSMLQMINSGTAAMEAMRAEARALGVTFDAEAAAKAEALSDAMENLKASFEGIKNTIGEALAPGLTTIAKVFTGVTVRVREWIDENPELIQNLSKIAVAAAGIGSALLALSAIGYVGAGIAAIATLATPLLAVSAILIGIEGTTKGISKAFGSMAEKMGEQFKGFLEDSGLAGAFDAFLKLIEAGWDWLVAKGKEVWTAFKGWLVGIFDEIGLKIFEALQKVIQPLAESRIGQQLGLDQVNFDLAMAKHDFKKDREKREEKADQANAAARRNTAEKREGLSSAWDGFKGALGGISFEGFMPEGEGDKTPEEPPPPPPGVPAESGVVGFFGGARAAYMQGASSADPAVNELKQVNQRLGEIADNTRKNAAVYA